MSMEGARERMVRSMRSLMDVSSCPVPTLRSTFGMICCEKARLTDRRLSIINIIFVYYLYCALTHSNHKKLALYLKLNYKHVSTKRNEPF